MQISFKDSLGWTGTQLLAWCALPAVIDVINKGSSEGYSFLFLLMWLIGEILCAIYVILKHKSDRPLLINYGLNIVFISIILYYKF